MKKHRPEIISEKDKHEKDLKYEYPELSNSKFSFGSPANKSQFLRYYLQSQSIKVTNTFACKNKDNGCQENFNSNEEKLNHELKCLFSIKINEMNLGGSDKTNSLNSSEDRKEVSKVIYIQDSGTEENTQDKMNGLEIKPKLSPRVKNISPFMSKI